MKKFVAPIALLVLAGCANQEVITMDTPSNQPHDLRDRPGWRD